MSIFKWLKWLICIMLVFNSLSIWAQCNVPSASKRVALVIGNSKYQSIRRLANANNDAKDIASILRDYGFVVINGLDLNQQDMSAALLCFKKSLSPSGVGLFFYAGHGVQVNNHNYLLPVDFTINRSVTDKQKWLKNNALTVNSILTVFSVLDTKTNIIILDACRNNPYTAASRGLQDEADRGLGRVSDKQGLARIFAPAGSFIAFATEPENTSSDGTGKNGLFTEKLLKHLRNPQLEITKVFNNTRADVIKASRGEQVPWTEMSMTEDFYFSAPMNRLNQTNNTLSLSENYPMPVISHTRHVKKVNAYLLKGRSYLYEQGRPEKALVYFNKAFALDKKNAQVYYEIAVANLELFEYAEAIQQLKQAIKHDPNYLAAYKKLASSYAALGDESKAEFYRKRYE